MMTDLKLQQNSANQIFNPNAFYITKMTFLELFLICIFKDIKLAEKWTNSAEIPKKSWTPEFMEFVFSKGDYNECKWIFSKGSQHLEFCQALASMGQIIFFSLTLGSTFASIWDPKKFTWTPYLTMFIVSHKLWALWKRLSNCWFFSDEGGFGLVWYLWLCLNKHV